MASPAHKRLAPVESLKYQRRMHVYRRLRGITIKLFFVWLIFGAAWLLSSPAARQVSVSQSLLVWSTHGQLDAAYIDSTPGSTQSPRPDRRSLATAVLLMNQPNNFPSWLERQVGEPLVVRSSLTLVSLEPTPGFEPLNDEDRVHLARVIEDKMKFFYPGDRARVPALNTSSIKLCLQPICDPVLAGLIPVIAVLAALTFVVGFVSEFREGLRSGLSPHACPSCDFDLCATPALAEASVDDAKEAPIADGRVYRQCPECGWKGRV